MENKKYRPVNNVRVLKKGREDIEVTTLNISLCKGLAQVIDEIIKGACVDADKSYVWLNASQYGKIYHFNACCVNRGEISGTSLIPPNRLKELLLPKNN